MTGRYLSMTTLRFTLSFGVRSPDASVRSAGRIANFLMISYDARVLFSAVDLLLQRRLHLGRRGQRLELGATEALARLLRQRHERDAVRALVAVDHTWLNSGERALSAFSSACGAIFLPPAVTMRSFFRSVMRRKPSSSWPMSPEWNQPSGSTRLGGRRRVVVVLPEHRRAAHEDLAVLGDLHLDDVQRGPTVPNRNPSGVLRYAAAIVSVRP